MPSKATLVVHIFDGTRKPFTQKTDLLIRILDGNQKQIHAEYHKKASNSFQVPFYDNFGDSYTVIAWAKDYYQAGFTPVKVSPQLPQTVDLMLLPRDWKFNFKEAEWATLRQTKPHLTSLLANGETGKKAEQRYYDLMEEKAPALASFFNITTAMADIQLPVSNALSYFKGLTWDESFQQDRFLAYADQKLVDQVKTAASQGLFSPEVGSGFFHPGATSSFKQIQFGEANVQLTFHDQTRRTIEGISCVKVEPDIDYYRDLAAHALLEVLPNSITGSLTDPKSVYSLRWIAGRRAGVPEFAPPFTIDAQ